LNQKPEILYRCSAYLAVYKPIGYLAQKSEHLEDASIFELPSLRTENIHVLTRIDRPVSGLVLVSRQKKFNLHFQGIQKEDKVIKSYIAIVEGKPEKLSGVCNHFLFHNKKKFKSYISNESSNNFKPVRLSYELFMELDNYSVLTVQIRQGKYHQIRAQLSHIGLPVKGDVKYGARRKNKNRGIHLHAHKIEFVSEEKKQEIITADLPQDDKLWQIVADHISTIKKKNG